MMVMMMVVMLLLVKVYQSITQQFEELPFAFVAGSGSGPLPLWTLPTPGGPKTGLGYQAPLGQRAKRTKRGSMSIHPNPLNLRRHEGSMSIQLKCFNTVAEKK